MQGGALHPVSFYKYWGCSAPLSKILGVLEHLQHPPSYAPDFVIILHSIVMNIASKLFCMQKFIDQPMIIVLPCVSIPVLLYYKGGLERDRNSF